MDRYPHGEPETSWKSDTPMDAPMQGGNPHARRMRARDLNLSHLTRAKMSAFVRIEPPA